MDPFIYHIPTKVYFGENQLQHLGKELSRCGKRVLLTYGGSSIKQSGLYERIVKEVKEAGLELFELSGIEPNPRVSSVNQGAAICREEGIDVLLAVGGGSVIDCTKFISAGAFYEGDAWDITLGKVKIEQALPIITVLTLAATGSEMDAGGVISNPKTNEKIPNGSPLLYPKVSFLDPTVTYTVNEFQTAAGSADIMSHIFEMYFTPKQDLFMLDKMMEGLMTTVVKYAPVALKEPRNYEARANLMWASSWAINGFIDGGKGQAWSCHPIEHELSAYYDITHGLGLAIVTPRWMEYILDEETAPRIRELGVQVFEVDPSLDAMSAAKETIERVKQFFFGDLGLKSSLSELGIDDTHFKDMARKARTIGSTQYGYRPLEEHDIEAILRMCL